MLKAWFHIKRISLKQNQQGISLVEVLLAVAVFGLTTTAVIGAIIYGRSAANSNNNRREANMIADEGIEAIRNIRDNTYANLADGTYGLALNANQWVLSGNSDTNGIFTREVTVTSSGTNRKNITSEVSWSQGAQGASNTSITTRLTNWAASIALSWAIPSIQGSYGAAGSNDGLKVATQGNYAYFVRNDGTPDFLIMDITNPSAPILAGSLSLTAAPTNIFVNGNYAYVSSANDSGELAIINITNPAAPALAGTFNAAGNSNGLGIYVVGSIAYLTRVADTSNEELIIINVANPASPVRLTGYASINANMYEVYVDGNAVYIATSSDTQEIVKANYPSGGTITITSSIDLPSANNALTIAGFGSTLVVGQGSILYTVNGITSALGSISLGGIVNDTALNGTGTLAFVGTANATTEFQVVNIATLATPSVFGGIGMTGSVSLNGVAYNPTLDRVPGVSNSDTQEFLVFRPN